VLVAGVELKNVLVRRRRGGLADGLIVAAVLTLLVAVVLLFFTSGVIVFVAPIFLIQLALRMFGRRWEEETVRTLRADDDGVRADGQVLATRDEILEAFALGDRPAVHL